MTSSRVYRQLIVTPVGALSGAIVAGVVDCIASSLGLRWVALTDVDVAPDPRPSLSVTVREVRTMPVATLSERLKGASQIVWASLFLTSEESAALEVRADETYEESTRRSVVVVRVVDASYIYVIGPVEVVKGFQSQLLPSEVRDAPLDQLDFPE